MDIKSKKEVTMKKGLLVLTVLLGCVCVVNGAESAATTVSAEKIGAGAGKAVDNAVKTTGKTVEKAKDIAVEKGRQAVKVTEGAVKTAAQAATQTAEDVKDAVGGSVSGAGTTVEKTGKSIGDVLKGWGRAIKGWFKK